MCGIVATLVWQCLIPRPNFQLVRLLGDISGAILCKWAETPRVVPANAQLILGLLSVVRSFLWIRSCATQGRRRRKQALKLLRPFGADARSAFLRDGWASATHTATLRRLIGLQLEALFRPTSRGATPTHGYVYQLHHGLRTYFGWANE